MVEAMSLRFAGTTKVPGRPQHDGSDEVHRIRIAKNVLKKYPSGESWDFGF